MTRTAVVVGGSSEIGAAIAVVFAELGYAVEVWGRDAERLEDAASRCAAAGAPSTRMRQVDVRDRDALEAAAKDATSGATEVAAVVWAAGVFQWGRYDAADPEAIEAVLETSLVAAAATARLFAPSLIAAAPSNLVFIGSAAGRQAFASNAAHVAAKHGLRGLAEALHLDLSALGVSVTTVTAGVVDAGAGRGAPLVQAHPGAVLTPADVARAVRFAVESGPGARVTEVTLLPAAV